MKVILQRDKENEFGTHGTLWLDDEPLCYTLEEPWRNNIKRISCIPAGEYECVKHNGSFKNVWRLLDVPKRTAVLIHAGNTLEDTEGCILVGTSTDHKRLYDSRKALNKLRGILPDKFDLLIINEPED